MLLGLLRIYFLDELGGDSSPDASRLDDRIAPVSYTHLFGGAFQEQHDDFRGRKLLAAGRGFVY